MAHKKGQGSSRNGRDSNPKMLGIKLYGGQVAKPGSIICRQKGTKWHAGQERGRRAATGRSSRWSTGTVKFDQEGRRINVVPLAEAATRPGLSRGQSQVGSSSGYRADEVGRCSSIG